MPTASPVVCFGAGCKSFIELSPQFFREIECTRSTQPSHESPRGTTGNSARAGGAENRRCKNRVEMHRACSGPSAANSRGVAMSDDGRIERQVAANGRERPAVLTTLAGMTRSKNDFCEPSDSTPPENRPKRRSCSNLGKVLPGSAFNVRRLRPDRAEVSGLDLHNAQRCCVLAPCYEPPNLVHCFIIQHGPIAEISTS